MRLILLLAACATTEVEDSQCCTAEKAADTAPPLDFAAQVEAPARCAQAAASSDDPWKRLWACVQEGRFTALRELLSGAWDADLKSRPDAPLLILRVIAER